jgi:hypothetical protein
MEASEPEESGAKRRSKVPKGPPQPLNSVFDIEEDAPLIVSMGLGIDSVAMVVRLHREGVPISAILFADTVGEKPETYLYRDVLNAWLRAKNMPEVELVKSRHVHGRYEGLAGNCTANKTLPSLAFGRRGCSAKWKHETLDARVLGKSRGPWKGAGLPAALEAQARGLPIYRAIGYDAGAKDARRPNIPDDRHFRYVYPLREFGMDREACIREILDAGLPVPIKSACFFCPASKPAELIWLHAVHPDLFMQALQMEEIARPNFVTIEGLWRRATKTRSGSWVEWAIEEGMARRSEDGTVSLIPHVGPLPRHPDEIMAETVDIARRTEVRMDEASQERLS